tara:strand:+ start:1414 stop:1629 length:216 start_codon:yes stop_codon:yes gene_type:complete
MKTFDLVVTTETWGKTHVEVLAGFDTRKQAEREGRKIFDALANDSTGEKIRRLNTSMAIHEISHHSNPWRA